MNDKIPTSVILSLAKKMPECETHKSINEIFFGAGVPGNPYEFKFYNKAEKVLEFLTRANNFCKHPWEILEKIVEFYKKIPEQKCGDSSEKDSLSDSDKFLLEQSQKRQELKLALEGVLQTLSASSGEFLSIQELKNAIYQKDVESVKYEFEKALKNLESKPLEAILAACNILESICKVCIEIEKLKAPLSQDLYSLWEVVSEYLDIKSTEDHSVVQDHVSAQDVIQTPASVKQNDDPHKIGQGIKRVVEGIAALCSYARLASGQGMGLYIPELEHAKFIVSSAYSLALFIFHLWDKKTNTQT
ncbi:hypothetical protein [Bartonella sp. F02]|uniref:hypothetical protein n=1 Tax=Bartonella sp. F02 TaxID=2967262 RepID=UPI0022A93E96|nr:hypothetical protein [Bartonella sp. F02]MCZ2328177.1 abortive infection family protein [Bartonella sp. F02]